MHVPSSFAVNPPLLLLFLRLQFSLLHSTLGFSEVSWWFQCLEKVAEPFRDKRNSAELFAEQFLVCLGDIICHCSFCSEILYSLLFFPPRRNTSWSGFWDFFSHQRLQMLWSYYHVTLTETKRNVCPGLHDLAIRHSWFCSLLYRAAQRQAWGEHLF